MSLYKKNGFIAVIAIVLTISGYFAFKNFEKDISEGAMFYMAFGACDDAVSDCSKPDNHMAYVAQSTNQTDWEILPNWEPFVGSVPDIIVRDNILYIYTAQKAGEITRYDLEKQEIIETQRVRIDKVGGYADPAPYIDEDGNIALFFLYCREGEQSVPCFDANNPGQPGVIDTTKEHIIGSATEVEGSNGVKFTLNDGDRVDLSSTGGTDPDIYYDGENFVMYVSFGQSFTAFTSKTLHGEYKEISYSGDIYFSTELGGVPSGWYNEKTKTYFSYAHRGDKTLSVDVIRVAEHKNLTTPLEESDWEMLFSGKSLGLSSTTTIGSPGIIFVE